MTEPQDPAAAGRGRLRAGHADREQVIETLKDAFAQGRLTRDELGARAGRALAAQTFADLAALTADIPPAPSASPVPAAPPAPAAVAPSRPPAPARRRPLAKAAAGSGGLLAFAFALVMFAANYLDPHGLGNPYHPWSQLCGFAALVAFLAALGVLGRGVVDAAEQKRPRAQLPPQPPQSPEPGAG
jgi:hypothetical protein